MIERNADTKSIFDWSYREGSSWWLAAFVFLSLLLHSIAFFILHGKDPVPGRTPRTAPPVQILTMSGDGKNTPRETRALLEWIAMQDPALVAKIQTLEPHGLTTVPYRASYEVVRTEPLTAPPEPPTIQFPPAREPAALLRSVLPPSTPLLKSPPPEPTRISVSDSLRSRLLQAPEWTSKLKVRGKLQHAKVLLCVNKDGETRFAFLQQGSENRDLDAEALAYLRTLRFAPANQETQWGTVTFAWGDDTAAGMDASPEPAR